ncbi:hypothetical protein [Clostridium butyricum]|uniref:hypothetical protein n=1 Tax=Clostridium butyricum TaxID=1492 RepID=UPI00129B2E9D|nr:hypothetical protein [Clostridium butyricum]QGH20631.1 hypothetical protein EBL75_03135 [Clostridium butyricum]QGH24672.1 hypothetical protein EBQ27_03135 [Clostridium butyricum]
MMISPESYYEEYLKGKTQEQIMTAIRGLKQEIGHLKNTMEHPNYGHEAIMYPSESTRLWCIRMYLQRAKQAFVEVGGTYSPSKAEQKALVFNESIPAISKLVFLIGGFFGGYETRTFRLDEVHLYTEVNHSINLKPTNIHVEADCPTTKDAFLEGISKLHIGEWRSRYTLDKFGYHICDGTQWGLKIYFSDGHKPVKIYGDNSYPYNFDEFQELLGIANDFEADEDE